jgi:hypothetical protein
MAHRDLSLFSISILDNANWLSDSVLALWVNLNNSSANLRTGHDTMLLEKRILPDVSDNITTTEQISLFHSLDWGEIPKFVLIETWQLNTSRDEHILVRQIGDLSQRSLNSIENCLQDTFTKKINDKLKLTKTYQDQALQIEGFQFSK